MICVSASQSLLSRVWLTPDLTIGFHQFSYGTGHYDGLGHTHGEYSIVMCSSGSLEILRGECCEVLNAGEITIVNPGEWHRCRFGFDERPSCGLTLIVRPAVLRSVLEAMSMPWDAPSTDIRFQGKIRNPEAFELTRRLIAEYESMRPGYGTVAESLLRQILVYLFRLWPVHGVSEVDFGCKPQLPWLHMHRATEYMNCHGKGAFRLSDLCLVVGLSASRFIPLFKNSSGISPHTYYNSLLVFKARRLLHVDGYTSKEAAYALGFRNVSHFCALFHSLTGATPQADRTPEL